MTHTTSAAVATAPRRVNGTPRPARTLRAISFGELATPQPPTVQEKYAYLAGKQRWVVLAQTVAFCLVAISTVRFVAFIPNTEIFLLPLLVATIWAVVSLITSIHGRREERPSHQLRMALYAPDRHPSVDVFLPTCGEPLPVLHNTYRHVADLEWEGPLEVHVLDDADRAEVRELARSFGFHYVVRPDRPHLKKAGNLRHAFTRTTGDFIAVFDADFAPRPEFVRELVPYFDQYDIGIVQSPQYFDVSPRQNWLERSAGATQEYFYRWVQASRDRSDGAICVGTNAMYRRKALELAGGFAEIGHSEDVHTGVNLLKVGYRTRYVPVALAKGLCPDNLDQFITQQYRWCTGSMSLLLSPEFHQTPMGLRQRLCFWSGFLYYISTALAVLFGPLPPIVVGWVRPETVSPSNYLLVGGASLIWLFVQPVITHGRGTRIGAARVHTVYSFAHAMALWHTARQRSAAWTPTGVRAGTALSTKVRAVMSLYLGGLLIALATITIRQVPVYGWNLYWPLVAYAVLSLWIYTPLVLGLVDRPAWTRLAPRTPEARVA